MSETRAPYRRDIDGLRALAVMAVLVNHITPRFAPGGFVGVDVFFVISGYLITGVVRSEMTGTRFSFARFYERRVRRLLPALYVMLFFVALGGVAILLPSDVVRTAKVGAGTVTFSSNLVLWRQLLRGYFAADARLNPLLHTWSLSVEEQFYLAYPALLLLAHRWAPKRILLLMWSGVVAGLVVTEALVRGHPVAVFFLAPFRAWELMVGGALAFRSIGARLGPVGAELSAGVGLLLIVGSIGLLTEFSVFPGLSALPSVLGTALLLDVRGDRPTWVARLLAISPVAYLGRISYSLYLWHWPAVVFLRFATQLDPAEVHAVPLYFGSLLAGSLSFHLVEQPFRHARVTTSRVFLVAMVCSALLLGTFGAGVALSGLPGRVSPEVLALDAARAPDIPFLSCDGVGARNPAAWCLLGDTERAPDVLVIGDSHALAWAPVIDAALRDSHAAARFVPTSACPPLLVPDLPLAAACAASNGNVTEFLRSSPPLTVILVARWGGYFDEPGPLTGHIRIALETTMQELSAEGHRALVLGPVPEYDRDVPLVLALALRDGAPPATTLTLAEAAASTPNFHEFAAGRGDVAEPLPWICTPVCRVTGPSGPMYRDNHHLSVVGAMSYYTEWAELLSGLRSPEASP